MKKQSPKGNEIWIPTREEVLGLTIGDTALDCFGHWNPVMEIFGQGLDVKGKAYVCYYTRFNPNGSSKISHSISEDEAVSTLPLISEFKRMEYV